MKTLIRIKAIRLEELLKNHPKLNKNITVKLKENKK